MLTVYEGWDLTNIIHSELMSLLKYFINQCLTEKHSSDTIIQSK